MKRLIQTHPIVFLLLVAGFVFDAVLMASTGRLWDGGSFALGSTAVVVYFLGPSALLRFVIFRRRLHLALAWVFTILLWFGWFVFIALLEAGPFRPSLLFVMCILAAFKTMRLVETDGERSAPDHAGDSQPEPEKPEPNAAERTETPIVEPPVDVGPMPVLQASGGSLKSLERVLCIMAAVGCLLALFDLPSEFYKVLRFVVVAACIALITGIQKSGASEKTKTWTGVGFGLLAVFYNPILPLDLDDEDWLWMNGACALAFFGFLLWNRLLAALRAIKTRLQGREGDRRPSKLTRLEKAGLLMLGLCTLTLPAIFFVENDRSGIAAVVAGVCVLSGFGISLIEGIISLKTNKERKADCPVPAETEMLQKNIEGLSEVLLECFRNRGRLICRAVNREAVDAPAAAKASRELLRLSNKIRCLLNNAIGNPDTDESEQEIKSARNARELADLAYMRFFTAVGILKMHCKTHLAEKIDRQIEEITGSKKIKVN